MEWFYNQSHTGVFQNYIFERIMKNMKEKEMIKNAGLTDRQPSVRQMKRAIREVVKTYYQAKARQEFRQKTNSLSVLDDTLLHDAQIIHTVELYRNMLEPGLRKYIDNVYLNPPEDETWYLQYESRTTYYRKLNKATAEFYSYITQAKSGMISMH